MSLAHHPAAKTFFSSSHFAVVGASQDRTKYGNTVLRWYINHQLAVTPINPKASDIEGLKACASLEALEYPEHTSVSVITPPHVTLGVLKTAQQLGIPALWLQPGSEDASVIEFVKSAHLADKVIFGGPCILVSGEALLADTRSKL